MVRACVKSHVVTVRVGVSLICTKITSKKKGQTITHGHGLGVQHAHRLERAQHKLAVPLCAHDGVASVVGVHERQLPEVWEVREPVQVFEIGDAVVGEVERLEVGERLKVLDARDAVSLQPELAQVA